MSCTKKVFVAIVYLFILLNVSLKSAFSQKIKSNPNLNSKNNKNAINAFKNDEGTPNNEAQESNVDLQNSEISQIITKKQTSEYLDQDPILSKKYRSSNFNINTIINSNYNNADEIQKSQINLNSAKMINIATKADLLPKFFAEESRSKTTSITSSSEAFFLAARNITTTKYGFESSLTDLLYGYWQKSKYASSDSKANYYANIKNKNNFTISVLETYKNIVLNYLTYSSAMIEMDIAKKTLQKTSIKYQTGLDSNIDLLRAQVSLQNAENEIEYTKSIIQQNIDIYNAKTKNSISINDIAIDDIENLDIDSAQSLTNMIEIKNENQVETLVKSNNLELLELKNKHKSLVSNSGYKLSTLFPNVKVIFQNQEAKYDTLVIKQTNILGTLSFKLFDNTNLTSYIKAKYDAKINQFELVIKEREIIDNAKSNYINMNHSLNKLNNLMNEYKLEKMVLNLNKSKFEDGEINITQLLEQEKKLADVRKKSSKIKLTI